MTKGGKLVKTASLSLLQDVYKTFNENRVSEDTEEGAVPASGSPSEA